MNTTINRFPVIPQPPHDPTWLLLNGRVGWREMDSRLDKIEKSPESGKLVLSSVVNTDTSLINPCGSFGGLTLPGNVAIGPDDSIYLLDTQTAELKKFDPCACAFKTVSCIGGRGDDVRTFQDARGIGIYDENLYVCDTGNHRLCIFALHGLIFRETWDIPERHKNCFRLSKYFLKILEKDLCPPNALKVWNRLNKKAYRDIDDVIKDLEEKAGQVLTDKYKSSIETYVEKTWSPYAVAFDQRGRVFVSDNANNYIHIFSCKEKLEWGDAIQVSGKPTSIALDTRDWLYVLIKGDEGNKDSKGCIQVYDCKGVAVQPPSLTTPTRGGGDPLRKGKENGQIKRIEEISDRFPPLPFMVDARGNLYLCELCAPKGNGCDASATRNTGVFDIRGNQLSEEQVKKPPEYGRMLFENEGTYFSEALDSKLYRCQWHRVILRGDIPEGASIKVLTYTAETEQPEEIISSPETTWEITWETNQVAYTTEKGDWDCLIRSGGGRYLWLKLIFRGNGQSTPALTGIQIEFPRISLRRYLPAVFGAEAQGADFLDRFLSIFDTTLRGIERKIDYQAGYLDPLSTPACTKDKKGVDFLTWLASWIGITLDRNLPEDKRRELVKNAARLHHIRGTRLGLWRKLLFFMGMEPDKIGCLQEKGKSPCCGKSQHTITKKTQPRTWQPPPLILEHYQLRRWLFVGSGRLGDQAVLWGKRIVNRSQLGEGARVGATQVITSQDPRRDPFHKYAHKFTVFVPAVYGTCERHRKALENLINEEKPAHTWHQIEYVKPRFRIGIQSMIGYDSVVGTYPEGVYLSDTPLGVSTVLGKSPQNEGKPSMEIGKQARIGTTTKLD